MVSLWIRTNVGNPLIIGPDSESEQWVAAVAKDASAPYCVLEKTRHGDRSVEIKIADLGRWKGRTPVLVDDIISTGRTMLEAIRLLTSQGWATPVCIAVHGLFAQEADRLLAEAGAQVVTSNRAASLPIDHKCGSGCAAARHRSSRDDLSDGASQ